MLLGEIVTINSKWRAKEIALISQGKKVSWAEINNRVNKLANAFLDLGLQKGERVAILLRNRYEFVEAYFALAKAGLVAVPLNIRLKEEEISYQLDNSAARVLIVEDRIEAFHREKIDLVIGVRESNDFSYDFEKLIESGNSSEPMVEVDEDEPVALLYTSGTIGTPKGAVWTHRNLYSAALINAAEFEILSDEIGYAFIPIFFAGGWCGVCLPTFLRGGRVVLSEFDPYVVLNTIEEEKITFMATPPAVLNMLMNHAAFNRFNLQSLRTVIVPGQPIALSLLKRAYKMFGSIFSIPYGATETGTVGTILHKGEITKYIDSPDEKRCTSIGRPSMGCQIKVIGNDHEEVIAGSSSIGEILVKGDSVVKGYWCVSPDIEETIKDGWWYSGDLAEIDEDGYIYIKDRKKDMIKSGGMNIFPGEVEEVICRHPDVLHAVVVGVPDEKWGETVKAIVMLKKGQSVTEEEIINFCKAQLASYKKPTSVEFVDSMPMTSTGKILKRELREKYWKGREKKV